MSRMEINALRTMADAAEAGRYTLPAELSSSLETYRRTVAIEVPQPQQFNADAAAARLVAHLAGGGTPDLASLVEQAATAEHQHVAVERARLVTTMAIEQATEAAVHLASDLTERIIAEHLRPAFLELLTEAREVAAALDGYGLNLTALITAPAKVRGAYAKLPDLVARHRLLWDARSKANAIGHRKAQHAGSEIFTAFEDAMAMRPGWKAPARILPLDAPTEPVEYLLWLVSPAAAPGKPWLPTIAEQDAAWWKQFGEGQEMRRQAHRNGMAVGARIG